MDNETQFKMIKRGRNKFTAYIMLFMVIVLVMCIKSSQILLHVHSRQVRVDHEDDNKDNMDENIHNMDYNKDNMDDNMNDEHLYSGLSAGYDSGEEEQEYYNEWKPDENFIYIPAANISEYDLQLASNNDPLIPKIIHQMWDTYDVPNIYIPWIKGTIAKHPDWEYWFWTADQMDCYVKEKHPNYYQIYQNYSSQLFRSDFLRYFILYDYGGLYFDLDVEVLKPMDPWRFISPSIISYETYEHTFFVYPGEREYPNVLNAIMMSTPKHPYYLMLQKHLEEYQRAYYKDVMHATGPFFVDDIIQKYLHEYNITEWTVIRSQSNNTKNQNYHKKPYSYANDTSYDMTVIDPKYWLSTFDPIRKGSFATDCIMAKDGYFPGITHKQFTSLRTNICKKHVINDFANVPDKDAFLDHHWVHSIDKNRTLFFNHNVTDIYRHIPNLIKVSDKLGLKCG